MKQYLDLCRYVIDNGQYKQDRTNTGTISTFGYQMRFDLQAGFPLLTTKRMYYKAIFKELLWFLSGSSNIRPLVLENVRIWNEWPYKKYSQSLEFLQETMEEFIEKIKADEVFANKWGDLGPVYGVQWRNFGGVDQVLEVERLLKEDPFSRRIIINAWNPALINQMALPPCHMMVQFYVSGDKKRLSCQLYQRSADIFLGVPFNIASYALLLHMYAHVCGYEVGELVHTLGDAHIYTDHQEQIQEQLQRDPYELCTLQIKRKVDSVLDFTFDDFEIVDYVSHSSIKGKVSV